MFMLCTSLFTHHKSHTTNSRGFVFPPFGRVVRRHAIFLCQLSKWHHQEAQYIPMPQLLRACLPSCHIRNSRSCGHQGKCYVLSGTAIHFAPVVYSLLLTFAVPSWNLTVTNETPKKAVRLPALNCLAFARLSCPFSPRPECAAIS